MHFISLKMHNWRQFLGPQPPITLSSDPSAPLTLLLGPNGSGKTGLLNAFTWCLYEEFTTGFDEPDKLIHDLAVSRGGDPYVEVALTFADEGDEFSVVRRMSLGDTHSTVVVRRKPGPGRPRAGETMEASINDVYNVLPPSLKDVFFFPAESLQTLSITDSASTAGIDLRKAIESLLGFDTYARASSNLNAAVSVDMLRQPQNYRDETIETARIRWEEAKQKVDRSRRRRAELPDLLAKAKLDLAGAEEAARQHDEQAVEAWVRERDELVSARETARSAVEKATTALTQCFRDVQYVLYCSGVIEDAVRALNVAERDGRIPPSISSHVLDKVLEDPAMPCVVCGREMDDDAHEHVKYLRQSVTDSNIAANALSIRSNLTAWQRSVRGDAQDVMRQFASDSDTDRSLAQLASTALEHADNALISARAQLQDAERALTEFESEQQDDIDPSRGDRVKATLGNCQRHLHDLENELDHIDLLVQEAESEEAKTKGDYERKAARREDYRNKQVVQALLSDTAGVFDRIAEEMRRYGQRDFERALNTIYARMINKPYKLEVADNFTIRATVNGKPRALSQSEKTALTLAFLGAVAGLAPQYRAIARKPTFAGIGAVEIADDAYPVVLDAPYSPFDDTYAGTITRAVGDLATQVVMPVSRGALPHIQQIESKVGKVYVLHLRTASANAPEGLFEDELVSWSGKQVPYVTIDETLTDAITQIEEL